MDSSYDMFSLKSVRYSLWWEGGVKLYQVLLAEGWGVGGGMGQCCSLQGEGSRGQADCLKHLWGG